MATTTWHSRGRDADSPKEISAWGWKDTLMRVKKDIKKDRLSLISGSMSYFALLTLVPALTSTLLIYAWVSDPSQVSSHLDAAKGIIPAEMMVIIRGQLTSLASQTSSSLGLGAIGSLLLSLISASKGAKAVMEAMNIIYDEDESRGFIKYNALALGLTILGVALILIAIAVIIGIPAFFSQFDLSGSITFGITAISWFLLLGLFSFFLSFAYRFGPNRNKAKWKWVSWGAVIAALLWAIASALFSWYASKFGDFNKTYGSLGAMVVLMMWFYISSYVVLLGGEINAELEHQTRKDSTIGKPKIMGERDAYMADTLGESSK